VHCPVLRTTVAQRIDRNGLAENNANNFVTCPPKHISGSNCIHKQVVHGTKAVMLNQKLKWESVRCWIVTCYMVVLMQIPTEVYTMISHLLKSEGPQTDNK